MSFRTTSAALIALLTVSGAAFAETISINDAYARASSANAKSGAAFMHIANSADVEDRLIAAQSNISERVEIHTHIEDANGVMRMVEVKDGIVVPAGGKAMLQRGGDHVMFMGLTESLTHGKSVTVTLTFEQAGDVTVEIPVDLERQPAAGAHGGHSGHSHSHSN